MFCLSRLGIPRALMADGADAPGEGKLADAAGEEPVQVLEGKGAPLPAGLEGVLIRFVALIAEGQPWAPTTSHRPEAAPAATSHLPEAASAATSHVGVASCQSLVPSPWLSPPPQCAPPVREAPDRSLRCPIQALTCWSRREGTSGSR